jgi:hypothetical protein
MPVIIRAILSGSGTLVPERTDTLVPAGHEQVPDEQPRFNEKYWPGRILPSEKDTHVLWGCSVTEQFAKILLAQVMSIPVADMNNRREVISRAR